VGKTCARTSDLQGSCCRIGEGRWETDIVVLPFDDIDIDATWSDLLAVDLDWVDSDYEYVGGPRATSKGSKHES
jgi:hypothetical protein